MFKHDNIHNNMGAKLFNHQIPHASALYSILNQWGGALDASDTGTGKTYTALAVAKKRQSFPIIVCPLAVVEAWQRTLDDFEMKGFVKNYEQYALGKTPYFDKLENKWNVPVNGLLIWDEAHYLKSYKAKRTKMARQAFHIPTLYLSATIANRVQDMDCVGVGVKGFKGVFPFMLSNHCEQDRFYRWHKYTCPSIRGKPYCMCGEAQEMSLQFRQILYNKSQPHANRMRRADIEGLPELTTRVVPLFLKNKDIKQINMNYVERSKELMANKIELDKLQKSIKTGVASAAQKERIAKLRGDILASYTHARRASELLKIETIVNNVLAEVEAGSSITVFVAFRETVSKIANAIAEAKIPTGVIVGGDSKDLGLNKSIITDRNLVVDKFSKDNIRVVIATISAGGVGISLHDIRGQYPRLALISLDWDAVHLRQAVGRVNRVGAKTPAVVHILYTPQTVEERIAKVVKRKLINIDILNNDDITNELSEFENGLNEN